MADDPVPAPARRHGERGASAVEYGLLIAAIAGVIVLMVLTLGGQVNKLYAPTCASIAQTQGKSCQ